MRLSIPTLLILLSFLPGRVHPQTDLYENGRRFYKTGAYQAAIASFQKALRADEADDEARYWLGMSYYQTQKYRDAKKQFRYMTGNGSADARAYRGLGMAYLKEQNRAFEALDAFREATRIDPNDPEAHYLMGMAYLTMMGRGPLAEHPYVDKARDMLQRALEIKPDHTDAAYRLGLLYEGESIQNRYNPNQTDSFYTMGLPFEGKALNTMSAMVAYERQLKINPDHLEARRALATLHSRLGNHHAAIKTFEWMIKEEPDNTERLLDMGIAYWRAKKWRSAQETFDQVIPMLPEKEQEIYTDFYRFTSQRDAEAYDRSSDEEQAAIWREFFLMRDPVPLTEVNERLIEHYGRVAYAMRAFRSPRTFPWDRRGDMVIRYGLPDHVEEGSRITESTETGSSSLQMRNWSEFWVYLHVPMTLYFENRVFSRRYDFPPIFAGSGGFNYDHPYYVARETVKKIPSQHIPRELGLPLDFVHDPVAFLDEDGTIRMEIAYGISRNAYEIENTGLIDRALDMGVVLYGSDWERVVVDSMWSPLFVPSDTPTPGLAVAVQDVEVPPGAYWMALQAHDRINHWYGVQRDSVTIPDFTGAGVKMSGIRLATEIPPEIEDRELDMRLSPRLAPNPSRRYTRGTAIHFYLELYDLLLGEDDRSRFQVEVSIHPDAESMKNRNIIWRMLSNMKTLMQRKREEQVVTLMFEELGNNSTASWTSAIDTSDLTLGRYRLEVMVTDLLTGHSVTQDRLFWVEKNDE